MVLEEHSLANALSRIALGPGSANPSTVPAFEQSLRLHLGKSIEASGSHLNDFADVVRFWEPEIVIAVDPSVIRRHAKERFVMRPSEWVRHCISIARTS